MISSVKARVLVLAFALATLGGCNENIGEAKHLRPLSYATVAQLKTKGMSKEDPILIRIFKEEDVLEVWKQRGDGRYAFFKSYDICKWSGELGPKIKEGDRQAPEGFYTVTPAQMNPNSSYHLSFNLGYPNTFDRAHGRTGAHLMVHGACSSAGCYAMSDEVIQEIYSLAREAFRGGQREFQVQALPFRMTPENMARHADDPNMPFWRNLKEGNDHFEVTGLPPKVGVCERQYVFNATPADPNRRLDPVAVCPVLDVPDEIEMAVAAKQMRDESAFQLALAKTRGTEPERFPAAIMTAHNWFEQGSADYPSPSQGEVQVAMREKPQSVAPAANRLGEAVSGVWSRLTGFARAGSFAPALAPAQPSPVAVEEGSQTPLPDARAESAAAQGVELPELTPASAFAPPRHSVDPFAVFNLFEAVDGAWVPADTVRR